jgi:hypothetical protein
MSESEDLPHIEPMRLLHARTGAVIGYRIAGAVAGPLALATGRKHDAEDAFWRLVTLSSLPRLRGELVLIYQDIIDDSGSGSEIEDLLARTYDGSVFISYQDARGTVRAAQKRNAYWLVLRLCARLGMITGRGIPGHSRVSQQPLAAADPSTLFLTTPVRV